MLLQVASYMRAVLRTLAQCHSHRILHRDIKPSNFMLLNNSDRSPLKAIGGEGRHHSRMHGHHSRMHGLLTCASARCMLS